MIVGFICYQFVRRYGNNNSVISFQIVVQSESLSRVRVPFTYLSLLQKMQEFGNIVVGFKLFDLVELLRLDFLIGTKVTC